MAVNFSAEIIDKYIAPGVSTFTNADIPDMSSWAKESPHWIANFFLNSAFSASFAPEMKAYAYNFLRRTQFAFSEHHLARESTFRFLKKSSVSPTLYVEALFHWECFLGQSYHAFKLLATAWEGTIYKKNDGSIEQRLHALYNQVKHVESRIESGQMLPEATVSVWLENNGLKSIDATITYAETADTLKELAKYANILMNPASAKEAFQKLDG